MDNNDSVLLCKPEVDKIQLLSTTANALSQRSCSLRLLDSFVVREKTLHIHIHEYIHIYTVLYTIFTTSAHFFYFVHYSLRENNVSIAEQCSRLLLCNDFISWVFGWIFLFLYVLVSFSPCGFCFLIVILSLPYGDFVFFGRHYSWLSWINQL